jgi:hypothetical protein
MSLKPHFRQSVPEETARVARAAFPRGTCPPQKQDPYMISVL